MIRICPSILNANFDALTEEIARVAKDADLLHLDVMDNVFVPNFTFDLARSIEIIDQSQLAVDVHLMVANVDDKAKDYAVGNTANITVHFEACADPIQTLRSIRMAGKRAGLAVKPHTPFSAVAELAEEFDMLLVMTVEPGFGGQAFMDEMMPKVSEARRWLNQKGFPETWIQVDGGISLSTIHMAHEAGADTFVAGSVVYKSDDPAAMVRELRETALSN